MPEVTYGVGSKIRARFFKANPNTSLAGMQLKFGVSFKEVVGIITDIRGDDPINPSVIRLIVSTDSGNEEVDPKHVVEILS